MQLLTCYIWLLFILVGMPFTAYAKNDASTLFQKFKQQVFQIRVVDIASGDKNTIGSGFQVSKEGHLATNYHVVASYVRKPEKFRLEYVAHDGSTGEAVLQDIDVIHDLAIVKIKPLQAKYFPVNLRDIFKGERIFSMGNPHDISMLIIEGNYNGLVQESRYKKMLFSGSLNPGMSGGPAFDERGNLIGVNVAKGGEQISYLVPATHLNVLFKRVKQNGPVIDFEKIIGADLLKDQQQYYSQLLNEEWASEELGEVKIPGQLDKSLKCWGHTKDKEDIYYKAVHKHCRSQDRIFIGRAMRIGRFSYDYEWITTDKLNRFQFYSKVEDRFDHTDMLNVSQKEDVTNYNCDESFINLSQHSWKVSTCIRAYKKYPGLYDVLLLLTSVDENDKTFLTTLAMSGVSKDNSVKVMQRFMGAIKWNN